MGSDRCVVLYRSKPLKQSVIEKQSTTDDYILPFLGIGDSDREKGLGSTAGPEKN